MTPTLRYIEQNWDRATNVDEPGTGFAGIDLPFPYTTASIRGEGRFSFFFYWDTYFTNIGLLPSGRLETARLNIENMLWFIERQGYMPNHVGLYNRSQPPYLCRMIEEYLDASGDADPGFNRRAAEGVRREYQFWTTARMTPCGLNGYGHHTTRADCIEFYDTTLVKRLALDPAAHDDAKHQIGAHYLGEAESGWDFCQRFDGRCVDHAAVDLNALLWGMERFMARAGERLGWGEASWYTDRAEQRRGLMDELLWDRERGWFYDYDTVSGQRSAVASLSGMLPLFQTLATPEQAAAMVTRLPEFEREFGVAVTHEHSGCRSFQWAYPNAWPCMVYVTVVGLARYGYHDHARRIASKYLTVADALFEKTGRLWEKTDVETGEVAGGEYEAVPMIGWSAGTYVALHAYVEGGAFPGV